MIKLQIIGNLGKDAIVKEINGKNVINFSVAHTEKYKDAQGNQMSKTTWVECAKWGDNVNVAPYLTAGAKVYVEGRPEADAYVDKSNAAKATLRMTVDRIELLGSNQQGGTTAANTSQTGGNAAPAANAKPTDDDLPF